jgi:hypothetical protein
MNHPDHEIEMARSELYSIAKYAIALHEMLENVSELEGMEGWQQSKITKAADYMESVYQSLSHEMKFNEAAPKGWEGTVKAMKKHKEIDNPWALAHYMKNKGYKSHKKEEGVAEGDYPDDPFREIHSQGQQAGIAGKPNNNPYGEPGDSKEASYWDDGYELGLQIRRKRTGVAEGSELKQAKRKYNQAAKDANADQVGAGKKIDTMKNSLRQRDVDNKKQGMVEDDEAVAAFLAKGGKIQHAKPQKGPKTPGLSYASKHIGAAGGRGSSKGKVSGLGANTGKSSNKPVVTAEAGYGRKGGVSQVLRLRSHRAMAHLAIPFVGQPERGILR